MRVDPGLATITIARCLAGSFDLTINTSTFLPLGYDPNAVVYRVVADDNAEYFLKVRFGPVHEPALKVPRALLDHGIEPIIAPIRTRSGALWCPLTDGDDTTVVLYPFVRGESAMTIGLTDDQWRLFGATLRAIHDLTVPEDVWRGVVDESFALPSGALARDLLDRDGQSPIHSPTVERFGQFWRDHARRIEDTLARAETLGAALQARDSPRLLCHADIHAANILVGEDGRVWLIDWDGPMVAPRERDLLFVIGSRIARTVQPREEALFFAGYGPVRVDPDALIYYRYERIIEDIGEFGRSILLDTRLDEASRAEEAGLAMRFFAPNGDLDGADWIATREYYTLAE